MKRKEFISRMIGEMSDYLLEGDPLRLVISLHQEKDGVHLSFFDDQERTDKEIEKIREALNPKRGRPELAAYYGTMAGRDLNLGSRLKLIGWQIKQATVTNTNPGVHIDLWLGSDSFIVPKK